jgi:hypothetical protein
MDTKSYLSKLEINPDLSLETFFLNDEERQKRMKEKEMEMENNKVDIKNGISLMINELNNMAKFYKIKDISKAIKSMKDEFNNIPDDLPYKLKVIKLDTCQMIYEQALLSVSKHMKEGRK